MSVTEGQLAEGMTAAAAPPVNTTTSIPTTPQAPPTSTERPFLDSVPAEYKEAGWVQELAKNEKPWDAMFKSHAGALEVVGKKTTGVDIPGENATPEQVSAFNKAIGVPEKVDGYEYQPPDITKEPEDVQKVLTERAKNTGFIDNMKAEALKAGITSKQFKALASAFDSQTVAQVKAAVENQNTVLKANTESQLKMFKEMYGDRADSVKQTAKDVIAKVVPQNVRDSKDANLALATMAMYIHEKVFKNDTVGGNNMGSPGMSKEAVRLKISELRATPAFKDWTNRDHKAISKQVDDLYVMLHDKQPGE